MIKTRKQMATQSFENFQRMWRQGRRSTSCRFGDEERWTDPGTDWCTGWR